jgi:hypothetical protein
MPDKDIARHAEALFKCVRERYHPRIIYSDILERIGLERIAEV